MNESLNSVITFAASGTKEDRKFILKALLNTFPEDELVKEVPVVLKRARRRKLSTHPYYRKDDLVGRPGKAKIVDTSGGSLPLVGSLPPEVESITAHPWTRFGRNILAFDCEMVDYPRDDMVCKVEPFENTKPYVTFKSLDGRRMKYVQKCAKISISDLNETIIYKAIISHAPFSFKVDYYTLRCNGIKYNGCDGIDTKDISVVKKEVQNIFRNNLIVTKSGGADFACLGLNIAEYKNVWYDLDEYYKRINGEPFRLKDVHDKIFGRSNFQGGVHSDSDDAIATIKIFKHLQLNYIEDIQFDNEMNIIN